MPDLLTQRSRQGCEGADVSALWSAFLDFVADRLIDVAELVGPWLFRLFLTEEAA